MVKLPNSSLSTSNPFFTISEQGSDEAFDVEDKGFDSYAEDLDVSVVRGTSLPRLPILTGVRRIFHLHDLHILVHSSMNLSVLWSGNPVLLSVGIVESSRTI